MLQVSRLVYHIGILYHGKYDKNTPSGEAAFKLWNFAVNAAPKAGVVSKDIYFRLSTTPGPSSKSGLMPTSRQSKLLPRSASNATTTSGTSLLPTTNGLSKPAAPSSLTTGRSTVVLSSKANPPKKNGKLSLPLRLRPLISQA